MKKGKKGEGNRRGGNIVTVSGRKESVSWRETRKRMEAFCNFIFLLLFMVNVETLEIQRELEEIRKGIKW